MADTVTPHYSWVKPEVGASAATWGAKQNGVFDQIDAQMFANQQSGVAIGSGALWFTATPPANWLLADGSSLDTTTYAKLFAVYGYAFGGSGANFNLPNLTNRFPMGAGTLAATGGEATHVLTAAELAVHAHGVSDPTHAHNVYDPTHAHGVSDPTHAHGAFQDAHSHGGVMVPANGYFSLAAQNPQITSGRTDTQQPPVHVNAAATNIGIQGAATNIGIYGAGTGIGIQNAGGGAAHNNLPPFLSINFIVRYQ